MDTYLHLLDCWLAGLRLTLPKNEFPGSLYTDVFAAADHVVVAGLLSLPLTLCLVGLLELKLVV